MPPPAASLLFLLLALMQQQLLLGVSGETGSRSSANASAGERDFRPPSAAAAAPANDIGGDLIGGRVIRDDDGGLIRARRRKRTGWNSKAPLVAEDEPWIEGEAVADGSESAFLRMHAFVVRDEDVPRCGVRADRVTKSRYFMCSGVILNKKHVLTSASCMNRAHIHEYHIDADLAVLIGALDENSYVIKIAHYEIHPHYLADPDSIHHATNNVAVLTLSCPIPRRSAIIVPKLPINVFDDVAHMCCLDRCKLSTVVENSKNHHLLKVLKVKHLPSPVHDDGDLDGSKDGVSQDILQIKKPEFGLLDRKIREPEAPILQKFDHSSESGNKNAAADELIKDDTQASGSVDWEKIGKEILEGSLTEENRRKISDSVNESMAKLSETMTQHITNSDNISSYFKVILEENPISNVKANENISDAIGKSILKFALEDLKIIPVVEKAPNEDNIQPNHIKERNSKQNTAEMNENEENLNNTAPKYLDMMDVQMMDVQDKKQLDLTNNDEMNDENKNSLESLEREPVSDSIIEKNVHCPPLGSPVVQNNTLVALIAYTCDDEQSWVEWKYVSIIHNIQWIRTEMKRNIVNAAKDIDSGNVNTE